MATIRKRNSKSTGVIAFQAVVRRQGYPDQRKTFSTLQAAEDWAYDIERDIRDRRVDPRALAERKTVRDAVQLYLGKMRGRHKSFKDTNARCEYFSSKIGGVALANLTAVMVDEAVDALDCSGPTQNRYLGAFSGCLEFVRKTPYAWITVNPVKGQFWTAFNTVGLSAGGNSRSPSSGSGSPPPCPGGHRTGSGI